MIENVADKHGRVPPGISIRAMPWKAAILVDLAHLVLIVELLDSPQLATPSIGEKKVGVVEIDTHAGRIQLRRPAEAA
jgi:hypothetical protein